MKNCANLVLSLGACFLLGCDAKPAPTPSIVPTSSTKHDIVREFFGGQKNMDTLLNASEATVQRLHFTNEESFDTFHLKDYDFGSHLSVSDDNRRILQRLLTQESSFNWESDLCEPTYGVLFTFSSGDSIIRVAMCFQCSQMCVFEGADNSATGAGYIQRFDLIRTQLVALAKSIFPDDQEIQKLK